MERKIHSSYSPDFRKNPKTDHFCAYCQKDLVPGKEGGWVYVIENDLDILHPMDYKKGLNQVSDLSHKYGLYPVGPECAKKIGKEWLFKTSDPEGVKL